MKRWLAVTMTALCGISLTLLGCGSGQAGATEKKPVTLRLFTYEKEELFPYIQTFQEKNPDIKIEFQFVDITQSDTVLNTQLASGQGPDLMEVGAGYENYVDAGYLQNINDYPGLNKYLDSGLAETRYRGNQYSLPTLSWYAGIFYNKAIFEANHLKVPDSWDSWLALCEQLKKLKIKPLTLGGSSWEPFLQLPVGLLINDFYPTEAAKNFTQDFKDNKKTLTGHWNPSVNKWAEMIRRGYITKDCLGMNEEQAQSEFVQGRAAMMWGGSWSTDTIRSANPQLKFGMMPFFGTKPGIGWVIGGAGAGFLVNAKVDAVKKAAIYRLFDYMSTPEQQLEMFKVTGGSSYLKGVDLPLDPVYNDCLPALKAGNILAPWTSWKYSEPVVIAFGKGLQDSLAGVKTVDQAIADADKKQKELSAK